MPAPTENTRREMVLRKNRFRYDLLVLLTAAVIVGGSYWTYRNAPMSLYFGDESTMGTFGAELLERGIARGDFSGPIWWEDPSFWGSSNPRVGVYLFGLAFLAAYDERHPERLESRVRFLAAAIALLTVYVFFRTLAVMIGVGPAYVGAVVFALHPVFRWVHVSVINDVLMLLFSLLTVFFAVRVMAEPDDETRSTRWWLWTAVCAGLAVATRLFALGLVVACGYLVLRQLRQTGRRALGYGLAMIAIVLLIFFATNPLLWWDPLFGLRQMSTGHVSRHMIGMQLHNFAHFEPLLRQTFTWFSPERLPQEGNIGAVSDWWWCLPGAFLTLLGLRRCRQAYCGLWLAFFLGFVAVVGMTASSLMLTWYKPKLALGSAAGSIALGMFGLDYLVQSDVSKIAFRRWRAWRLWLAKGRRR